MIERITVRGLSLTPRKPVQTAAGTLSTTPLVLIDVRTDDAVGWQVSSQSDESPLPDRPL